MKHVSGQVFRMKEWENQLGQLEKASEMTEDDFQVQSNIVFYENAKNDPRSFTRHVEETLNELRAVSLNENYTVKGLNFIKILKLDSLNRFDSILFRQGPKRPDFKQTIF